MRPARRLIILSLTLAWLTAPVFGQLKSFPWFNRGDPKITTRVYTRNPGFRLACKDVGVFPFAVPERDEPRSLDFSTSLRQALLTQGAAETIAHVSTLPWDDVPAWKAGELSEDDKARARSPPTRPTGSWRLR